jgi:3'-phosphoadenosine 5'-phosphosulfate sulfotransferase (PAPS reductase)/FAD synthetase
MYKVITARLRAFLFIGGVLSLTSCEALRNALTPAKTEVVITDTIYLPKEVVDTVTVTLPVDTIVIETERVSARVIRSYDTISVEAECKADTITITKTIELPTKVKTVTKVPWWWWVFVYVGGLVILVAFVRIGTS